jgi:arylsulfatase A-like enzyme
MHRTFSRHRRFFDKLNFLILMCDEERFPPVHEDEQVRQWRKTNLVTQELLRDSGLEFKRHYTGATACAPARGTIFTGQYPSLHGVTQTTGAAKGPYDPDTFWLDPNNVPTMGDYFRAAGYRIYYKGKWHVSAADLLISGTHQPVLSYDKAACPGCLRPAASRARTPEGGEADHSPFNYFQEAAPFRANSAKEMGA